MIASAEEFIRLRESDDPEDLRRAANEEATPKVWLEVIAEYPAMRFWVAQNKTVPISVLATLAQDPDRHVRGMVALKRKLPAALQLALATDPDERVRERLANNAGATTEALRMIATGKAGVAAETAARRLRGEG